MMAACPNCRANVSEEQMFCRTCGFRLDVGFQISTRTLGLPATPRVPASAQPTSELPRRASWRNYMLPIVGFICALFIGGFSVAMLSDKPLPQLISSDAYSFRSERSFMGVYLVSSEDETGAIIDRVVEASPAEKAGLVTGDRIVAINDFDVDSPGDVVGQMSQITPGSSISVRVMRDDNELTMMINTVRRGDLQLRAECHHQGFLGVGELEPIDASFMVDANETVNVTSSDIQNGSFNCTKGVHVGMVVQGSAAENAGLQQGDVILGINDIHTHSPEELSRRVRATAPNQTVDIHILRDGTEMTLMAVMGNR